MKTENVKHRPEIWPWQAALAALRPNWADMKVRAAANDLLEACESVIEGMDAVTVDGIALLKKVSDAVKKAKGL